VHPVLLAIGPFEVRSYAVAVLAAFAVAAVVRRAEVARLGYDAHPGHPWVGAAAIVGGVVGSKVGMVLFEPWADLGGLVTGLLSLDLTGKTVLGGLLGGWAGVELAKRRVGIGFSTGDGFAVALPLGQAIGRIGCLLEGCCHGAPTDGPIAIRLHDAWRHPVQLYEAVLDVLVAVVLWSAKGLAPGARFRLWVLAYALIRFALDPLRGDAALPVGPLTALQWACLATAASVGAGLLRRVR
jgi:phosphatidylglycerol:prolipoprotein diacylglycerol transferase